jgi:hypothetical protein
VLADGDPLEDVDGVFEAKAVAVTETEEEDDGDADGDADDENELEDVGVGSGDTCSFRERLPTLETRSPSRDEEINIVDETPPDS